MNQNEKGNTSKKEKISREDIKHIAKLSKLIVEENEIDSYAEKLTNIVDMARQINKIDTSNIKSTTHVIENVNVFRKDEVKTSKDREEILKNAPSRESGCISVLKVVE